MKSNAELYLDTPCVAEFAYWKFALLATLWNGIAKRIAKKKKKKKGGGKMMFSTTLWKLYINRYFGQQLVFNNFHFFNIILH